MHVDKDQKNKKKNLHQFDNTSCQKNGTNRENGGHQKGCTPIHSWSLASGKCAFQFNIVTKPCRYNIARHMHAQKRYFLLS